MPPRARWCFFKNLASNANQRPSSVCTLPEITTWVCNCGSSNRDGRLTERGGDQTPRVWMQPCTVGADSGGRSELFEMIQHSLDRDVVTVDEPGVTGQRPQHAHRLRRRQRRVEPGNRGSTLPLVTVRSTSG